MKANRVVIATLLITTRLLSMSMERDYQSVSNVEDLEKAQPHPISLPERLRVTQDSIIRLQELNDEWREKKAKYASDNSCCKQCTQHSVTATLALLSLTAGSFLSYAIVAFGKNMG